MRGRGAKTIRALRWAALAAAVAGALGLPVAAELRRVEAVGVVPIHAGDSGSGVPRDAAVRAAVQSAVLRVARSLLPEDFVPPEPEPPPPGEPETPLPEPDAWVETQLGDDPFAYAVRFSILEDRGPRPVLFGEDPDAEEEYVVVAEVQLDVDAIRQRLVEVGALVPTPELGTVREVTFVVEGLRSYRPLAALRDALSRDPAVLRVVPTEFTAEHVLLAVSSERPADALVADLQREVPANLRIVPVETGPDTVTLLLDWSAPSADAGGAAAPPAASE